MCDTVTLVGLQPLRCSSLQNATISKMKSDNFKALQKRALNDSFATDNALCAQLRNTGSYNIKLLILLWRAGEVSRDVLSSCQHQPATFL
jgi:hypothetical protein